MFWDWPLQTQSGETRQVNEINLTDVQFLGGRDQEAVGVGGQR